MVNTRCCWCRRTCVFKSRKNPLFHGHRCSVALGFTAVTVLWNRRSSASVPLFTFPTFNVHILASVDFSAQTHGGFVLRSSRRGLHDRRRSDVSRRGPVGQETRRPGSHDAMHLCRKRPWRVELCGVFPAER